MEEQKVKLVIEPELSIEENIVEIIENINKLVIEPELSIKENNLKIIENINKLVIEPELSIKENNVKIIKNIKYNTTFSHTIENLGFGNLEQSVIINIFTDGRPFAHFIERWLEINYPLKYVPGCKKYDHTDINDENIKYDQKTFTEGGCRFMPSNMIGQGRKFDKKIFDEKAKKLIYIIISNIEFPEIKIKFVKGIDLIVDYPTGNIPLKDFIKFFN